MAERAFVTGATGAVGAALIHRLIHDGWHVTALHRPTSDLSALRTFDVELVPGDLRDAGSLTDAVPAGIEVFFHLGADLSTWSRHAKRQIDVNVNGTRNAVQAALAKAAGRFVHVSSISAYGRHAGPISEDTPSVAYRSPVTYERSKWQAELAVRDGIVSGLDAVIVNPCAVMGPGITSGWAALFFQIRAGAMKALPPGEVVVNHIDEVAVALIAAARRGRTGENYILPGDRVPLAELIREAGMIMGVPVRATVIGARGLAVLARISDVVSRVTGREPDLTPDMAALMSQTLRLDTDKAQREFGYRTVPWRNSVREMYDWLRAAGRL